MAGPVTLATLRTRVRQRTDQEHSGSEFITDDELDQLINTSYLELYGHLVRAGIHYSESTQTLTSTGATTPYDLAADFYALLNVFRVETNGNRVRLTRHDTRHRPSTGTTGTAVTYRVIGDQIQFSPWPQVDQTYELIYVPLPGTLSADLDTVDGVLGWEEYVVVDVSIRVHLKEDPGYRGALFAERERLLARIQDEAAAAEMVESWVVGVSGGSYSPDPEGEYQTRGYRGSLDFPVKYWRW